MIFDYILQLRIIVNNVIGEYLKIKKFVVRQKFKIIKILDMQNFLIENFNKSKFYKNFVLNYILLCENSFYDKILMNLYFKLFFLYFYIIFCFIYILQIL